MNRTTYLVLALLLSFVPVRKSWAQDEVDKAFAAGNQAAKARRFRRAAEHHERARKLAQGPSAKLSYNLGTAYAQLGQLGYATVHLRHALELGDDAQLLEDARQNLGLVRRQAQTQAAASGRVLSEPAHWSAVVIAFLGTRAVGCVSVLLWWLAAGLAMWCMQGPKARRRSYGLPLGVAAAAMALSVLYVFARQEVQEGEYIVVGETLALREGPGEHRPLLFEVQPSSRARILQQSSGWAQVQLPGARQGWMVKRALAPLQPWSTSIPVGVHAKP